VEGSSPQPDRRLITTPIVVSIVFVIACAVFAVSFVGARGGLQLPVASRGPVAVGSGEPSVAPATESPEQPGTAAPTLDPAIAPTAQPTPAPTVAPTAPPTAAPTAAASPVPTAGPFARPTLEPGDPLLGLPTCRDHPGCFLYVVARGDTFSGIISRYRLDFDVLAVLNPDLDNPNVIVLGQTLYLGRDPYARLDPCPDGAACYVYVVRAGDSVSEIAARFGLTTDAILEANPGLPRPIVAGQQLRLPA
jgi:hypothetical protein